jgi:hypothetical protein
MADFEIYIDDNRYSVPSLYLITASSEDRARVVAEELLRASSHHKGVEVRRDGAPLYRLGSCAVSAVRPGEQKNAANF